MVTDTKGLPHAVRGAQTTEARMPNMSKEELPKVILTVIDEAGVPLPFRKMLSLVHLKDPDASTFEVQRAVSRLIETGALIEDDSFRYRKAGAPAPK